MENGIRFDLEYETMPWHRVDAVVFDIGNILIRYAPKDFLEQLFPGDAQKQQDMLARVYNGPYWERFDRGEMEYADQLLIPSPQLLLIYNCKILHCSSPALQNSSIIC